LASVVENPFQLWEGGFFGLPPSFFGISRSNSPSHCPACRLISPASWLLSLPSAAATIPIRILGASAGPGPRNHPPNRKGTLLLPSTLMPIESLSTLDPREFTPVETGVQLSSTRGMAQPSNEPGRRKQVQNSTLNSGKPTNAVVHLSDSNPSWGPRPCFSAWDLAGGNFIPFRPARPGTLCPADNSCTSSSRSSAAA